MAKNKSQNVSAAPISKYAAKRADLARQALEERKRELEAIEAIEEASKQEVEQKVEVAQVPIEVKPNAELKAKAKANNKAKAKVPINPKGKNLPAISNHFPQHFVDIALIIKNNAEIRRFTALGVINFLLQKQEISGDKRYVSFKWNKFCVKANGLIREYSYNEPFFLNALVAAFASFSASAQRTIDRFVRKEMSVSISKAVDDNEVERIFALNELYQQEAKEETKEETKE